MPDVCVVFPFNVLLSLLNAIVLHVHCLQTQNSVYEIVSDVNSRQVSCDWSSSLPILTSDWSRT